MYTHGTPAYISTWDDGLLSRLTAIYPLFDGVITLSRVDRLFWQHYCENVICVSNPVYLNVSDVTRADLSGETLLWVGRLDPSKNFRDLIPIMNRVVRDRPSARLVVVGSAEYDYIMEDFRKEIAAAGLSGHIALEGFKTAVMPYYAAASVFISTSNIEGFPTTLVESKACGLPCVAYALPYLELHRDAADGNTGLITVKYRDIEAMASGITELLDDASLRRKMGDEARKSVMKYACVEHDKLWADIISGITDSPGSAGKRTDSPGNAEKRAVSRAADEETSRILIDTLLFYTRVAKEEQLAQLSKEVDRYRLSRSFKIGWQLTSVPRWLRGIFKRLRRR
jgi:glycosyltransferase involved in cell wall biosynthesis